MLLLLLDHLGLRISWLRLRLHLLVLHLVLRGHTGINGHVLGLRLLSDVAAVAVSTLSLVRSVSTTVIVVLITLVTTLALILPAALVVVVALLAISTVHIRATFLVTAHLIHLTIEKVLHKILLHFVEASELALLMQFLSRHPELDGQGTGAERCRLVEALDGALGVLDVTVEDKVLAVGGVGVEVLTLSEFDGDDGANLLK